MRATFRLSASAPAARLPLRARIGAVRHSSRSCGLTGLANVGKSTLFNALVRAQRAQAANYPFCTIEPNVATVHHADARTHVLASLSRSEKVTGSAVEFHDIAGLIEGAHKGEGLGNAFLGNIRAVSVIVHVVRCFDDPDIIHVMNSCDAVRDVRVINNELLLADLQSIEKRVAAAKGKAGRTPDAALAAELLQRARAVLEDGHPASTLERSIDALHLPVWRSLQLLTQKPVLYVCNVSDAHAASGNDMTRAVEDLLREEADALAARTGSAPPSTEAVKDSMVIACAQLEAEAALLTDDAERGEFLSAYGLSRTCTDSIIEKSARLLRTQTFYTTGPTETRAWSIPIGATAVDAAGTIHTDFAKGFIKAEVTSYDDFVACGGEDGARKAAKTRAEGKEYIMVDGDVCLFRFNVAR